MTTDHDPRELRAIAERVEMECDTIIRHGLDAMPAEDQAETIHRVNDLQIVTRYILATVREDDGEEQPPTIRGRSDRLVLEVQVGKSGKRIRLTGDAMPDATVTFNIAGRYTRGQFRDLCRGLGITPEAATPETPG